MIILRIVAVVACFLMAMMAAKDAERARLRENMPAFVMFLLFAMLFSASMVWVLLA